MASRYRLTPAPEQEIALRGHCAHARFVWNLAVEQQSWWWPGRGSAPGSAERCRQLAEARATEPWLREGSSSVQQQALRDFDRAMAACFDPENPARKPSFRRKRGSQGFVVRDVKVRRLNQNHAEVFVPKCGYVRFRLSRDLPAKPGMARVTCDRAGRWPREPGGVPVRGLRSRGPCGRERGPQRTCPGTGLPSSPRAGPGTTGRTPAQDAGKHRRGGNHPGSWVSGPESRPFRAGRMSTRWSRPVVVVAGPFGGGDLLGDAGQVAAAGAVDPTADVAVHSHWLDLRCSQAATCCPAAASSEAGAVNRRP